jgi:hypothetical protein
VQGGLLRPSLAIISLPMPQPAPYQLGKLVGGEGKVQVACKSSSSEALRVVDNSSELSQAQEATKRPSCHLGQAVVSDISHEVIVFFFNTLLPCTH